MTVVAVAAASLVLKAICKIRDILKVRVICDVNEWRCFVHERKKNVVADCDCKVILSFVKVESVFLISHETKAKKIQKYYFSTKKSFWLLNLGIEPVNFVLFYHNSKRYFNSLFKIMYKNVYT